MIEFENTEVVGWEAAIRGMRNPLNSWDKSDSWWSRDVDWSEEHGYIPVTGYEGDGRYFIGPEDQKLMMKLRNAGTDHRKFMRMIVAYVDITAPLFFYKQLDTYRFGVEKNSCSTMHTIADKEFTIEDFSCEHLINNDGLEWDEEGSISDYECYKWYAPKDILKCWIIPMLNLYRKKYLEAKDKKYWWQMIQLLPSSYNQRRTYMFSYEALVNIYHARKNHKLDEWKEFCKWIESLPYSQLIIGEVTEK